MAHHRRGLAPHGVRDWRIERLHEDAIPSARVPNEVGRGSPRHIAHVVRREAPGERRGPSHRSHRRLPDFALGDDGDCRIGAERPRQPRALGCRQDLHRIGKPSGAGDDESARHRDREIDVAVFQVELALAEVLFRVPAAHIVVDGEARIPLGDLVEPALGELLAPHPIGAVLRHLE